MIECPRAVQIYVSQLAIAREWYCLALESEPDYEDESTITFNVGGCQLTLLLSTAEGYASTRVYWGVDHLKREYHRISSIGREVALDSTLVEAHTASVEVLDPFGNVLGLIATHDKNQKTAKQRRTAQKLALQNVRETLDQLQQKDSEQQKVNRVIGWVAAFAVLMALVFAWTLASLQVPSQGTVTKLPIKTIEK